MTVHHGRDQWQRIGIAADSDGQIRGLKRRPAGRHGRLPDAGHAWRPAARRRSCTLPSTRWTPTRSAAPASSPPRCRPTPTAALAGRRRRSRSSGSWTNSPSNSAWTRLSCANGTGSSTRSSRTPRSQASPTTQGTTRRRPPARRNCSATTLSGQSRQNGTLGVTRSGWASASRPSRRCAAWLRPGCSARCPTGPAAGSTPRSGCCRPARSRWSPGRARTARGTRRHGARSSPTSSACRSRTSGCCTATPRSRPRAWTPTGRDPWRSAGWRWSEPATR